MSGQTFSRTCPEIADPRVSVGGATFRLMLLRDLFALVSHHVREAFWEPSPVIVKLWAAMGSVGGSDRDENALGGIVMKGSFQGSSVCSAQNALQQMVSRRCP